MRSLLSGLASSDIRTEPFPHIVVQNVFAPELCEALVRGVPGFASFGWDGPPPNNMRYQMPAHRIMREPQMSALWQDFARTHSSPEFLAEIAALFDGYWSPDMLACLGGSLFGHTTGLCWHDAPTERRILLDARLEINTPVFSKPGSPRGAHLDTPNRLYSGLYYLRDAEDDSVGGDLTLYRFTGAPPPRLDQFAFDDALVEAVATVPYRANTLVLFPQGLHAIHGVSPRALTPWMRKYVFITAEIAEDWLVSPTAAHPAKV